MARTRTTNLLLALALIALIVDIAVSLAKPTPALAERGVQKGEVAAEAQATADQVNNARVLGEIASALREVASSNKDIASAIREHARSTDRIARSVQGVADSGKAE